MPKAQALNAKAKVRAKFSKAKMRLTNERRLPAIAKPRGLDQRSALSTDKSCPKRDGWLKKFWLGRLAPSGNRSTPREIHPSKNRAARKTDHKSAQRSPKEKWMERSIFSKDQNFFSMYMLIKKFQHSLPGIL